MSEDRVWVPDRRWTTDPDVIGAKSCRMQQEQHASCPQPAVAALARSNGWWCYCVDHLYGRRVVGGVVEIAVHPESSSAKRGFSE